MNEPLPTAPPPPVLGPTRVLVDAETILDARLAIFHRRERWLAVADVHFGYELSQRAAGALFPGWGMASVEARLLALLADYRPASLVIVGDFVHDRTARPAALSLLATLREHTEIILVAGNHDRRAFATDEMASYWLTERFCFHHGDAKTPADIGDRREVIGHHHPAGVLSDGAGVALKLPAFVETEGRWVLPAFSPWAAGGSGRFERGARRWLCSSKRVLPPLPR